MYILANRGSELPESVIDDVRHWDVFAIIRSFGGERTGLAISICGNTVDADTGMTITEALDVIGAGPPKTSLRPSKNKENELRWLRAYSRLARFYTFALGTRRAP